MNSREYEEAMAPPPPYYAVVNDNGQEYCSNRYSDQSLDELRRERMFDFNKFVRRYESKH